MWTMQGNFVVPQYYNKLEIFEEETYASLRVCLEEKLVLEWPFEFWDNDSKCRIWQKMESLNGVVGDVYVLLQESEVDGAPKWRLLVNGSHIANPSH